MKWIRKHNIELGLFISGAGLTLSVLSYLGIMPTAIGSTILAASSYLIPILFLLVGLFIGLYVYRIHYKYPKNSNSYYFTEEGIQGNDKAFQDDFAKCPFWIKVFLKTILEKGSVYADAKNYSYEDCLNYLLYFVTYKTVKNDIWCFSMRTKYIEYFESNPHLLDDVSEDMIKQNAKKYNDHTIDHFSSWRAELHWWYYSDEDYIEPKVFEGSNIKEIFKPRTD